MNRAFIAAAMIGFAVAQAASQVYDFPNNVRITMHHTKCGPPVKDILLAEFKGKFKTADIELKGQKIVACWTGPDKDGDYIFIDSAGQGMAIHKSKMPKPKQSKKIPNA